MYIRYIFPVNNEESINMIVLYTRYNVIESLDAPSLLSFCFECVTGMRNVPESFKNLTWDGNESMELKSGRNVIAYELDGQEIVAFRVAIVDQNEELWTTDIVLDVTRHEIQLRLAREKKIISAEYDRNFHVPYMFKKLVRDGIGGWDEDLPISDVPVYIDESNISIIADLIINNKPYSLPVVYVSHPFYKPEYDVDVNELAKDMAGSAHVLVEKDSSTTSILRGMVSSQNAYNGGIDVFYDDDSFRYLCWPEISANQFRYKISHSIYSRMAMRNIDDAHSISTIKLKNKIKKLNASGLETQKLSLKVEELSEKYNESQDMLELAFGEIKSNEKRINELENDNHELRNKVDALTESLNRKQGQDGNFVSFAFTEKQFYEDEIKRIILECIKNTISTYGSEEQRRRDYHIMRDIVDNNMASDMGDTIKNEIMRVFRKNKFTKSDVEDLKGFGFEIQRGGHDKYVFGGDDRYIITVANSPSDFRDGENLAHEAVNLIFGRT